MYYVLIMRKNKYYQIIEKMYLWIFSDDNNKGKHLCEQTQNFSKVVVANFTRKKNQKNQEEVI